MSARSGTKSDGVGGFFTSVKTVRNLRFYGAWTAPLVAAILFLSQIFDALERVILPSSSTFRITRYIISTAMYIATFYATRWALRRFGDTVEPDRLIERKRWKRYATKESLWLGGIIAFRVLIDQGFLIGLSRFILGLPGIPPGTSYWWEAPMPVAIGVYAFAVSRRDLLRTLASAQPPELRLAVDLTALATAFKDRALSLERAMEEATLMSHQMQRAIELERRQLLEVHEDLTQKAELNELTEVQATAVAALMGRQQARGEWRALLANIIVGTVFFLLGLLAPLLLDLKKVVEQLEAWFSF